MLTCEQIKTDIKGLYIVYSNFSSVQGAMRLSLCEAPTRQTRPDHNTGKHVPYSYMFIGVAWQRHVGQLNYQNTEVCVFVTDQGFCEWNTSIKNCVQLPWHLPKDSLIYTRCLLVTRSSDLQKLKSRGLSLKGALSRYLATLQKARRCLRINWIPKLLKLMI